MQLLDKTTQKSLFFSMYSIKFLDGYKNKKESFIFYRTIVF